MSVRRTVGCLLAAVVLAAGCGDDDSDGGDDGLASATEPSGGQDDARTDAERQADEEMASATLLTIDDFPPGWEAQPPDDDDDAEDEEIQQDIAACLDVDEDFFADDDPAAESPNFSSQDDEEVTAEVTVLASAEEASQALEIMQSDAMPGCYAEAVKAVMTESMLEGGDELPEGVALGEPTFNPISFAELGDASVAFRLTVPVTAQGVDVDYNLDVVMVHVGRFGISSTFSSIFSPFDSDEAARLIQVMLDRIPAAEAA